MGTDFINEAWFLGFFIYGQNITIQKMHYFLTTEAQYFQSLWGKEHPYPLYGDIPDTALF